MIELTEKELEAITDVLRKESGILYDDRKKYLIESRLSVRLEQLGLSSFTEYLRLVQGICKDEKEVQILVSAITTNETSFFRNADQINVLVENLIPEIAESNRQSGRKSIKIWSAASSTGEEIRSISMALQEAKNMPEDMIVTLYASDINDDVLNAARRGVHTKYSVRNTPAKYMNKYFTKEGEEYRLDTRSLHPVIFKRINLIAPPFPGDFRGFDVVYCANVLIYFGHEEKEKAVRGIYDTLMPNGYLFVGHSESLHNVTNDFKLTSVNGIPAYRKITV